MTRCETDRVRAILQSVIGRMLKADENVLKNSRRLAATIVLGRDRRTFYRPTGHRRIRVSDWDRAGGNKRN